MRMEIIHSHCDIVNFSLPRSRTTHICLQPFTALVSSVFSRLCVNCGVYGVTIKCTFHIWFIVFTANTIYTIHPTHKTILHTLASIYIEHIYIFAPLVPKLVSHFTRHFVTAACITQKRHKFICRVQIVQESDGSCIYYA